MGSGIWAMHFIGMLAFSLPVTVHYQVGITRMWQDLPCDVVFMDCLMPELDGYEATGRMRELEMTGSHTPIVALTACTMPGDREKCLQAGMDDYIAKPLDAALLSEALERWAAAPPKTGTNDA